MLNIYYLPVENINGTDIIAGSDLIHDAILDATEEPDIRKLIMEVTQDEHNQLSVIALAFRATTDAERDYYTANVFHDIPDPDIIRAKELLANSPDVISQPEMWELMRIFGRLLGIPQGI